MEVRSLEEIRTDIDRVDSIIKKAFLERMSYSREVALWKKGKNAPVYQPDREKALIERLTEDVDPAYRADYEALIREILKLSRGLQERILEEE